MTSKIYKFVSNDWVVYHLKFLTGVWFSLFFVWLLTRSFLLNVTVDTIHSMFSFLPIFYVDFVISAYHHPLYSITQITLFCGLLGILKDFLKGF